MCLMKGLLNVKFKEVEMAECIFPKCVKCEKGYMIPFSFREDVFEKWKCSNPNCDCVIQKREML